MAIELAPDPPIPEPNGGWSPANVKFVLSMVWTMLVIMEQQLQVASKPPLPPAPPAQKATG